MKRVFKGVITVILCCIIISSFFAINVFAAGTSIDYSNKNPKVGDTVVATIRINSGNAMYAWQAQVQYDNKKLQFVDSTPTYDTAGTAAGIVQLKTDCDGSTSASAKITFKVIGTGSTTVSVKNAGYSDGGPITSISGTGYPLNIVDKSSANKSSNANLKYITPSAGTLSPKFSPSVTTYSITIPNNVTTLTLGAGAEDSSANWDVEGSKDMKVGANKRVIVVTAADGTQKRYTLNVTRLDADGTTPPVVDTTTENPTDEIISVTADGKDKIVSETFDTSNVYPGYSIDVCTINGKEVACIKRDDTVLVYLTDIDGQNGAYFKMLDDGTFTAFKFLSTKSGFYEFLETTDIPSGYSKITLNIDGVDVTAYQNDDPLLTEFALVFAKGPEGYIGFYRYDTTEKTMQRAVGLALSAATDKETESDGTILEKFMALDTTSKVIAVAIVGAVLLLIVAIVVLIVKLAKPRVYEKYTDSEEYEENEDEDEKDIFDTITVTDRDEDIEK